MEAALEASSVSVAHKLMGSSQLQTLTESSSSGSITESVCTQYEPQQAPPPVVEHAVEVGLDSDQSDVGFKKSSSAFFEGFLNASNMLKNLGNTTSIKAADGIRLVKAEPFLFSTSNFQQTDHRLHLYLHQNVFLESNEKFGSVVRVRYLEDARQGEAPAILVLSTRMIYLFLVTGEEDDDPGQWLRLIHRRDLKEWTSVQVLPSDIGLRLNFGTGNGGNNNNWNLLMEDGQHTRNYLQAIGELERPCTEEMCADHRRKLKAGGGEEEPLIVAPLKGIVKTVNERAQLVDQRVALLVTSKTFAVLSANWKWLIEGVSEAPEVVFQLALEDMVECEVESETAFVLNFMDEQEKKHELWRLEFETKYAADSVLEAIKGPWEKVFGVSLVTR